MPLYECLSSQHPSKLGMGCGVNCWSEDNLEFSSKLIIRGLHALTVQCNSSNTS